MAKWTDRQRRRLEDISTVALYAANQAAGEPSAFAYIG
jgi:hypothetical protein